VLKCQIQDLQDELFLFKRNITSFEKTKKNLENEVSKLKEEKANCIQRLTKAELKIRTTGQTPQTMHMYLPETDPILDLRPGLGFSNPSYLEMVKRKAPSLYNTEYMRRDTFKDYMFVPNDISNEEIQKRLMVKQKKTNFSYFSADYGLINKENALERKPTNSKKHMEKTTVNPYDSSKYESLARKTFCHLRNQISGSLRIIRAKQEFQTDELVRSNSYEIDVSREVKKQIKLLIEPPVNSINDKLKVFEEALMTEMKNDLNYVTSLEDEYDLICLKSEIQKEYFQNQIKSIKPQFALNEEKIATSENRQTSLEMENLALKESLKQCLQKNVELNEELSCQNDKFENSLAKLEKQSLIFESNWQRKIEENKYNKLSYENSLKLILKENEELKYKVLDLRKTKNNEFTSKRQLDNINFSYFSNQPTFLATSKQQTRILDPKQKEVLINPKVISPGMYNIASTSKCEPYGTNDMLYKKELEKTRMQALLSKDTPLDAPMCSLTPPPIEKNPKESKKHMNKNRKKHKLV
jgi:chromosome segregation ATPase